METLEKGTVLRGQHEYIIEKMLNKGGFGIIYKAEAEYMDHHISQTGTYAIKEFFPEGLCHREGNTVVANKGMQSSFDESYKEFKAEADCLYGLHHKGIVPVNEVIEANGTLYYVMKYLHGQSLEEYINEKGGKLDEATALDIIRKVGDALTYLHQGSILHLDVNPSNIMMVNGRPVLIDFGSFRKYESDGSLSSKRKATCVSDGYSPSEQYESGGLATFSPSADVYSLGATLLHLLTGHPPVEATEMSNKWIYLHLPDGINEHVSTALCNAMAKQPSDRTGSVSEFIAALSGQAIGGTPPKKKGTRKLTDLERERRKKRQRMAAAAIATCVAIGALLFFQPKNEPTTPEPEGTAAVSSPTEEEAQQPTDQNDGNTTQTDGSTTQTSGNTTQTGGNTTQTGGNTTQTGGNTTQTGGNTTQTGGSTTSPTPAPTPTPPVESTPTSGTLDLDYAVWTGGISNGKPDGKGTMRFKSNHKIDSRDLNNNVASPGDEVTGRYSNGHLVYGTWTKSSTGESTKLMIGQ